MGQSRDRLARLAGSPRMARLTRRFPSDPTHNGFVLGLGHDLVLIYQFHDFYPEGYAAVRISDVKRVRSGQHERFWEAMLRGEGLMERVGIPYEVPLGNFRALLSFFHERGQHVIVECESRETADDDIFLIGRVISVSGDTVAILNFDTLGSWDDEPSEVAFGDITQVHFDTPYINTISKYLKEPPAGNGRHRP